MPCVKLKTAVVLATMVVVSAAGACSDNAGPESPPPPRLVGAIVSDPIAGVAAAVQRGAQVVTGAADGSEFVYATLLPGTAPQGAVASVRSVLAGSLVWTTVRDGGFDPVPLSAAMGDTVEIQVRDASNAIVHQVRMAVAALRRPVVARVVPPPRKRDVPLNTNIVVVFSEPVAEGTLASSVRLFSRFFPVPGTVRLLPGTGAEAVFIPSRPLSRNGAFRLVVTGGVRDLQGDALEAGSTTTFTTGQSSTGQAASITVSPDTVYLGNGATYQVTASVSDAAGSPLVDQSVVWSTSDPNGLRVSQTGRVTALAIGYYFVYATVNGLTGGTGVKVTAPPASVELSPAPDTVGAGDTIVLTATVRSATGDVLFDYPPIAWASSDAGVASVPASSDRPDAVTVTAVAPGNVTISANSAAATGVASIVVTPPRRVASVIVDLSSATILPQATLQLSATLADSNGRLIVGRPIAWTSDAPTVATVDANGLVTGVAIGRANVIATSEGLSDTAAITVQAITFGLVSAGQRHTCAATADGAAYCWGEYWGQNFTMQTVPLAVAGATRFTLVRAGEAQTCGLTAGGVVYCWSGASAPFFPVPGGLTFASVSVGGAPNVCGVTTSGDAYCWGRNLFGELGDGTTQDRASPTLVAGGLTFAAVAVGKDYFTCGLTTSGAAYCWGRNQSGQFGNGTFANSSTPTAVSGGLTFTTVVAGYSHACGLTASGDAYCWGGNWLGQLGNGSVASNTRPVLVSGGYRFTALSAGGGQHTCGLSTDGTLRCWGSNVNGQLGIGASGPGQCPGAQACSTSPAAVAGGLVFSSVSAGGAHTCGMTTTGILYCWGGNQYGEIGDGSTVDRSQPVKVASQP